MWGLLRADRSPSITTIVVFVLFGASRLINLDGDSPPWAMAQLQPIDELYYTVGAFNIFHYGTITHSIMGIPDDSFPVHIFQNLITSITLLLFGNNFYGLRMAPVLLSCCSFGFLLFSVKRAIANNTSAITIAAPLIVAVAAIVTLDFSFWTIGTANDPQCYSLFIECLILALCAQLDAAKTRLVWLLCLGFYCVFSFTFVYLYNLYLICGVSAALGTRVFSTSRRDFAVEVGAFIGGGLACLLLHEIVLRAIWGTGFFELIATLLNQLDGRSAPLTVLQKALLVADTNIFRINPGLLFALLFLLPAFLLTAIKRQGFFERAVVGVLLFRIVEAQFQTDFTVRKLVVLFPIAMIVISGSLAYILEVIRTKHLTPWTRVWLLCWAAVAAVVTAYCVFHNPYLFDEMKSIDANVYILGLFSLAATVLLSLLILSMGHSGRRRSVVILGSTAAALFLMPNIVAVTKYRLLTTHQHRDAMKSLSPLLDHQTVAAGWSFGMRLYNSSIPVMSGYSLHYYRHPAVYRAAIKDVFDHNIACCLLLGEKTFKSGFPDGGGLEEIAAYDFGDVLGLEKMGLYVPAKSHGIASSSPTQ